MTHSFMVSEAGLSTEVDEVISMEEYYKRSTSDFTPNRHWYQVTVRSKADQEKWVKARNNLLYSLWSPNQTQWEKENYYGPMLEEAKKTMDKIEVK